MKNLLIILCAMLLPLLALAEEECPICGGTSETCMTDEYGAAYCSGTLVSYPEEQTAARYAVREGTRIIGQYAFENPFLEEVVLPEGVVMIEEGAFSGCTGLRHAALPDSLLIISGSAFCYCPELAGITLPPHLYAIGPSAFADCWKLTSIDIPETVRYIGDEAFCNTSLTEVWWRPVFFETGFNVFDPDELYGKARPKTVHVSEVLEHEIGDIANFCAAYEDGYGITFVVDIPYRAIAFGF